MKMKICGNAMLLLHANCFILLHTQLIRYYNVNVNYIYICVCVCCIASEHIEEESAYYCTHVYMYMYTFSRPSLIASLVLAVCM